MSQKSQQQWSFNSRMVLQQQGGDNDPKNWHRRASWDNNNTPDWCVQRQLLGSTIG
jgi:hypothetical protein